MSNSIATPNARPEGASHRAEQAERHAREVLARAEAAGSPLKTPSGRARSPVTLAEYRRGRPPANKGKRYPAEVLSPAEIGALLDAFPGGLVGARSRALIVLLWRSGLRVGEAVALRVDDVDLERGEVTVLRGKGAKRRGVGIDDQAAEYLRIWLRARSTLELAPAHLFCTVSNDESGPGRPLTTSAVRQQMKRYARKAGIRKRVHPHGLRHTHAFELANEAVPLHVIRAQLGHSDLSMTARYIDHLSPQQVLAAIAARHWPGETPAIPETRAAASQGRAVPLRDVRAIQAYTPQVPPEPRSAPSQRAPGETKAKILEVVRATAVVQRKPSSRGRSGSKTPRRAGTANSSRPRASSSAAERSNGPTAAGRSPYGPFHRCEPSTSSTKASPLPRTRDAAAAPSAYCARCNDSEGTHRSHRSRASWESRARPSGTTAEPSRRGARSSGADWTRRDRTGGPRCGASRRPSASEHIPRRSCSGSPRAHRAPARWPQRRSASPRGDALLGGLGPWRASALGEQPSTSATSSARSRRPGVADGC